MVRNYFVYIARCSDGSYYTGFTNDLKARQIKHNAGQGARYTRGRRPIKIIYWEKCSSKKSARQREYSIKKLSRRAKALLIHTSDKTIASRCVRLT